MKMLATASSRNTDLAPTPARAVEREFSDSAISVHDSLNALRCPPNRPFGFQIRSHDHDRVDDERADFGA